MFSVPFTSLFPYKHRSCLLIGPDGPTKTAVVQRMLHEWETPQTDLVTITSDMTDQQQIETVNYIFRRQKTHQKTNDANIYRDVIILVNTQLSLEFWTSRLCADFFMKFLTSFVPHEWHVRTHHMDSVLKPSAS
jgi:hypothetical protein